MGVSEEAYKICLDGQKDLNQYRMKFIEAFKDLGDEIDSYKQQVTKQKMLQELHSLTPSMNGTKKRAHSVLRGGTVSKGNLS